MKVYSLEKMRNKRDKRQDLRLCEALGENAGNHLGYGLVFFLVLICCEFCESLFESRQNVTSETIDTDIDPNESWTLSAPLRTYPSPSPTIVS